jgi:hypothetical protein
VGNLELKFHGIFVWIDDFFGSLVNMLYAQVEP